MRNRPHVLLALIVITLIPMLFSLSTGCGSSGGDAVTTTTTTTSTTTSTISISNPTFNQENVTTVLVTYESGVTATQEIVDNQVVVTLASGQTQADLESLLATEGGSIIGSNSYTDAYQISVPAGTSAQDFANTLDSSSVVDAAGTNPILYLELTPNDEYYNDNDYNWMFLAVSAEAAWDLTTGETSVAIGMVDNGLYRGTVLSAANEAKFQSEIDSSRLQFAAGCDRIDNDDDPTVNTENGYSEDNVDHHGIQVAGIMVAKGNNANYMAGMNWNSWFYPFRASSGETDCQTYLNALSTAIYNNIKVINCSTGSFLRPRFLVFANNQPHIDQFKALAALAESKNIMIVTSAGNSNNDGAGHYPSCLTADYDSVISVGGLDSDDARYYMSAAEGSNYGTTVDIAAPGEGVYTLDNPYFTNTPVNGTSVAAPFVTGTISLMFSLADSQGYDLTVAEVKSILKSSTYTDSLSTDKSMGYKLNAYKALLGVCEKMSKAVVKINSNLSGAAVYVSSNGGSSYSSAGKTTNADAIARVLIDSGSSINYKIKLTKSGYSAVYSSAITGASAGAEVPVTANFGGVTTSTTTTTTTTSTTTTTLQFSPETVDNDGDVGLWTSIAIDSNDKVHISYYDSTNGALRYVNNTSGSWSTPVTVDNSGPAAGQYTSIALDSSNKAHISYIKNQYGYLMYATNTSGSWVTTRLDDTQKVKFETSIAIDSDDYVHIAYYGNNPEYDLKYGTNSSDSWVYTDVDTSGIVGCFASIALDSSDNAYISYQDITNTALKYATNSSGSWVDTTLDSASAVGYYTSIALDSNSRAYISYIDEDNDYLKLADRRTGAWTTPADIIDCGSPGNVGYTSIALDGSDKAHIAYYDADNTALGYGTNSSGSWDETTVDNSDSTGRYASIALDSNGKAHFAYYSATDTCLKYAKEN